MSDRTTEVNLKDLDDVLKVETLTLIVLGLIQRGWKTFDRVKSEIEYEESEKIDPETYSGKPLRIDSVNVQRRAAHDASREFAEFFKHLRDSLRNVILDVEKQEMQERLFTSDDFWRSFIVKAANSPKTEQVNWDFKQTLDMWHIKKGDPEKVKKENKFAEIVAGFANKKGGVIIVGVTDTSPRQIVGLKRNSSDVENYMKYTAKVIRQYISYEKDFFHLQQVNVPTPDHNVNLCLVIVIQQTTRTIGVKGLDGKSYSYPLREETGLVWKDEGSISSNKLGIKSDNFNFLSKLQQFMNQEL